MSISDAIKSAKNALKIYRNGDCEDMNFLAEMSGRFETVLDRLLDSIKLQIMGKPYTNKSQESDILWEGYERCRKENNCTRDYSEDCIGCKVFEDFLNQLKLGNSTTRTEMRKPDIIAWHFTPEEMEKLFSQLLKEQLNIEVKFSISRDPEYDDMVCVSIPDLEEMDEDMALAIQGKLEEWGLHPDEWYTNRDILFERLFGKEFKYVDAFDCPGDEPTWALQVALTFERGSIEIENDHVTISDQHGEIAHWIVDEWTKDPSMATAMANAIKIFYEQGPGVLRKLIGKS